MKRLLLLSFVCLLTATTIGCQSGRNWWSGCRLFTGYRGAPCDVCTPAPCACPTPVYSQSIPAYGGGCCSSVPVYGGYAGCGDCGGFGGCSGFGGYVGGCADGSCGQQYLPGTVIPGEGMIIDGGQIPSLPGGTLAPQTTPVPQTTPQTTPGPAAGN